MGLKHIIFLVLAVLVVAIAVLEWFLCIALSRSERRREKRQVGGNAEWEELSESKVEEEKTEEPED